jgi:hypothetical protein
MVRKITLPEAPPVITGSNSLENENRQSVVANNPAVQESPKIPPPLSRWAPGGNNHADRPCSSGAVVEDKPKAEEVKRPPANEASPAAEIKPATPLIIPSNSGKEITLFFGIVIAFGFLYLLFINYNYTNRANVAQVSDFKTIDLPSEHGSEEKRVEAPVFSPFGVSNQTPLQTQEANATLVVKNKPDPSPRSPAKTAPPENAIPKSTLPKNEPKKPGFQEWLNLAEQGDLQAQAQIGHMYGAGEGVGKNYEAAFRWNLVAAKRGSTRAQSNLGVNYGMGNGVDRDNIEACAWWHIAARSGSSQARNNLKKYDSFFTDMQKAQAIERARILSRSIRD